MQLLCIFKLLFAITVKCTYICLENGGISIINSPNRYNVFNENMNNGLFGCERGEQSLSSLTAMQKPTLAG